VNLRLIILPEEARSMFDPRIIGNAHEHVAKLRKEAQEARLTRGATTRLARFAARTFRTWANQIDGGGKRADQPTGNWQVDTTHGEAYLAG
jgi:hypothetical protein